MKKTNLRQQMPVITTWIDSLREVFGKDLIDQQLVKGMKGEPTFYASENNVEVGTRIKRGEAVRWDERGISRADVCSNNRSEK